MFKFNQLKHNLINIPGWTTSRKIVVIESDDWGSIRMPSKEVFNNLKKKGYEVDQCPYCKYDSLANEDDLIALYDVLRSVIDKNGKNPVITADTVVANPDFEKIEKSGFKEYFFEPFTETLNYYQNHSRSFELWKQGINNGLFHPQFHAREHLNVARWMRGLQKGDEHLLTAFQNRLISISVNIDPKNKNSYMDSFDYDTKQESDSLNDIVISGLNLFEEIFGYRSESFIASCYIWSKDLEKSLADCDVKYIQGTVVQSMPTLKEGTIHYKKRYHYLGERNKFGQRYLLRNCFFEPSQNVNFDWIGDCLSRIRVAFAWGKPATISVHRLNFIGNIDETNRTNNLKLFKELLLKIVDLYPEVEFMTSDQLGELIAEE